MKIMVPVNEENLQASVSLSLGRAPHYLLYDTENKESRFFSNEASDATGGAGIQAAQKIIDQGVDLVLTPRCGKNAADVLSQAGIRLMQTPVLAAEQAIALYLDGKLSPLDKIHPGFHSEGPV